MFDNIFAAIEKWMRELLSGMVESNLSTMFTAVNQQTSEIAAQVGQTPQGWNSSIFSMIRNISDSVVIPIAGIIITLILCYELISMLTERNNLHDVDTWMFFKYFVKMWIAVYLVSHTFDIAMAVFDIGQSVVNSSSGIIRGNTAIDISSLSMQMQAAMATMAIGELVTLALETLVVSWCLKILSVVITVIMYGRMIEIYLYTSLAPIPFATMSNREWGHKRANGFNYTCGFQAGLNQKWTVVSVNRILKNESYTGTLIQGKRRKINYKVKKSHDVGSENWIRVEDAHDAIISKGEFQQVQQLLELDTRTAPSQITVYPLSGFLRCADCGQNMIRRTVTKNGKKYQYYHCSTYKNGGGCTPHMINSEKLTESVLAAIRHQVTLLVEAEKVLSNAELASGEQIGIKILDSQITALEAELERYSNLKIRLYQDLCDDVVSREEYGEMNTRFAQKIKEAQDKIQEIREKKQEALKHDTLLPTWLEEFKQYEHIKTLERRVVVELIDHIDVHSKTEIEIHFCFEDELHSITEKFMEYQAHHGNEVAEE